MIRKLLVSSIALGILCAFVLTASAATSATPALSSGGSFEAFAPEAFIGTAHGDCQTTQEEWLLCMTDCLYAGGNWRVCAPQCNELLCGG